MLELLLIVSTLSLDALVVSFAYGANKIKISPLQKSVITAICSIILVLSIGAGQLLHQLFPSRFTTFICFFILIILGIIRLLESILRKFLESRPSYKHTLSFSALSVNFDINITLPLKKDCREYKYLTLKEALYLGIGLSLDSIAIGIGVGLANINYIPVMFISLAINSLMLVLGNTLGYQFAKKIDLDLSWVSGLILILLAVSKLT